MKTRGFPITRRMVGLITGTAILSLFSMDPSRSFSADIYIQIQRGEKVSIGLPSFAPKTDSSEEKSLAKELEGAVKDDFLFTRLFNLVQDGPSVSSGRIDFQGWEHAGADVLVVCHTSLKEPGSAPQMVASVFEVPSGNSVFQKTYSAGPRNARKIAHEFVADFLYRFTGIRGISESKIVFSNDSTGYKELYLIDYDGSNLARLTEDKSIDILPRWSPDGKEIAYTSYAHGNPDIYVYSLAPGSFRPLSVRKGLNSAPAYSPDGKTIAATLSFSGAPNLYLLNRQGRILRQIAKINAAETSPSFSPDGRHLLFTSDRPGWPQIYMIDSDGSNMTRLTESGYCDSPVWSPKGDKIAYSKGTQTGKHDIVIQDLVSGKTLQITNDSGSNENPSFSPDGRFLVFSSTRNRKRELYIASVDGTVQKRLADINGNCFTPSWGP